MNSDTLDRLKRDPLGFSRYFDSRAERKTERDRVHAILDEIAGHFVPTPRLTPLAFRVRRLTGFSPYDRDVAAIVAEHTGRTRDPLTLDKPAAPSFSAIAAPKFGAPTATPPEKLEVLPIG